MIKGKGLARFTFLVAEATALRISALAMVAEHTGAGSLCGPLHAFVCHVLDSPVFGCVFPKRWEGVSLFFQAVPEFVGFNLFVALVVTLSGYVYVWVPSAVYLQLVGIVGVVHRYRVCPSLAHPDSYEG